LTESSDTISWQLGIDGDQEPSPVGQWLTKQGYLSWEPQKAVLSAECVERSSTS